MVHEAPDLLCCSYFLRFCLKIENLLSCSDLVRYFLPNCSLNLANMSSSWPGAGEGWRAEAKVTETKAAEMRATFIVVLSVLETQGTETKAPK